MEDTLGQNYYKAMCAALNFAVANRQVMTFGIREALREVFRITDAKATGHPVLIPGSMGTSSYILVGREAGKKSYYTVCHGAGRVMSRSQARKTLTGEEVQKAMGGILINERNIDRVKDEAPQAYKQIDDIIESVEGAGLARAVAQCIPMGVIKGAQEKRWR